MMTLPSVEASLPTIRSVHAKACGVPSAKATSVTTAVSSWVGRLFIIDCILACFDSLTPQSYRHHPEKTTHSLPNPHTLYICVSSKSPSSPAHPLIHTDPSAECCGTTPTCVGVGDQLWIVYPGSCAPNVALTRG